MTRNFYEFYCEFALSEAPAAKLMLEDFREKYSRYSELDCNLVTEEDMTNLLLMEEYLGQEGIYMKNLEKELTKKPRTKTIAKIQKSCLDTLKKHPKPQLKRDWIFRYHPDPRTPEQREAEHLSSALITISRDGLEAFARRVSGNLDLMEIKTDDKGRTK